MVMDLALSVDELAKLVLDGDEIVVNFRDRYGDHRVGRIEEDPEMSEYEEWMDLGASLASVRR